LAEFVTLARRAQLYLQQREALGFPLLKAQQVEQGAGSRRMTQTSGVILCLAYISRLAIYSSPLGGYVGTHLGRGSIIKFALGKLPA